MVQQGICTYSLTGVTVRVCLPWVKQIVKVSIPSQVKPKRNNKAFPPVVSEEKIFEKPYDDDEQKMLEKSHQTLLVQGAIKSIWKKTHAPPLVTKIVDHIINIIYNVHTEFAREG